MGKKPVMKSVTKVAAAKPLNYLGAFVHFQAGQPVDFQHFPKAPGDVKGKQPFADLIAGLQTPKGDPVRLRIGQTTKALAMPLGTPGLSPDAERAAKQVPLATYRRDPLGWLNYAIGRQRPLVVGDGAQAFIVLPRVDPRWVDDPVPPTGPERFDGLSTVLLILADRLARVPGLADDTSGIRADVTALRGDIGALVGELKSLTGDLKNATVAMRDFAATVGGLTADVSFAIAATEGGAP